MLRHFNLLGFLQHHHSFRLLSFNSVRRFNHKDDSDDEDDRKANKADPIHLNKSRGQHLLTNPRVLDTIVRKANIKSTDTVLEIGPGTGNLTLKLLEVAHRVVAVEVDQGMVEILGKRISESGVDDRITVICKDALKTEFPQFDLIVANIPYGISSPLIAKIVFGAKTYRSATLLLQKEFAHRLLANPGDSEYNRLAVNVKLVADVEFIMNVSKRDFVPIPKVDSSVVTIYPKSQIPNIDMHEWWAFTLTCFSKKNKTLGATFKQKKKVAELFERSQMQDEHVDDGVTHYSYEDAIQEEKNDEEDCSSMCSEVATSLFKDKIIGVLKSGGFEDKRPSKLSNEELLELLALFNEAGIHFHHQAKRKEEANVRCTRIQKARG